MSADALALAALRYASSLEYVEDFEGALCATLRDPFGRAALTMAYQQAQAHGRDNGGEQCCGTTGEWHRPWCETGPRRTRPAVSAAAAAAERHRIKAAGAVSVCCGASYTRPAGAYSRWVCGECGRECDLIGVIG